MSLSPIALALMSEAVELPKPPKRKFFLRSNRLSTKIGKNKDNSLRYGQIERRRKQLRKANFAANVRYRRAIA